MKRSAFTLIELLAVIAVIGILVSILIPAISSVRKQADNAACTSNLRQLSNAYLLMTVDNNNILIPAIPPGGDGGVPDSKWWSPPTWNMSLNIYMNDGDQTNRLNDINCPAALAGLGGTPSERSSYGYNHYVGKTDNPNSGNNGFRGAMRMEQLADPSKTLMFGDTGFETVGRNTHQLLAPNTIYAWHDDHANVSYFDGSVRPIDAAEARAVTTNSDEGYIMWRGVEP